MNTHTHTCKHTHRPTRTRMHTHTHTHKPVTYQGNEMEEKVFKKRKVFKEDLKEPTEVISLQVYPHGETSVFCLIKNTFVKSAQNPSLVKSQGRHKAEHVMVTCPHSDYIVHLGLEPASVLHLGLFSRMLYQLSYTTSTSSVFLFRFLRRLDFLFFFFLPFIHFLHTWCIYFVPCIMRCKSIRMSATPNKGHDA